MNTDTTVQKKKYEFDPTWKTSIVFALVLSVVCGLIFIFKYDVAYDDNTGGGWLPPSFSVIFSYFFVSVASIVTAICLKLFLKKNVRLWGLLLVSVLAPIICYNVNYHALKKDGAFHFLVDEGGIFHFIVIGDFNFDGINDERYHILYEKREYSTRHGGHYDDDIIHYIDTSAIGTGVNLNNTFSFYDHKNKTIDLHLNKYYVEFEEIKVQLKFKDIVFAENAEFYIDGVKLNAIIRENVAELVFDAKACSEWQANIDEEFIEIIIEYRINE